MSQLTIQKRIEALHSLKPGAKWVWSGDDHPYSELEWRDSNQTKPTEAELDAEIARLATLFTNNEYQRKRAAEYPSLVDQLDDIYHNGIDAWKATIKTTKDKYPKP